MTGMKRGTDDDHTDLVVMGLDDDESSYDGYGVYHDYECQVRRLKMHRKSRQTTNMGSVASQNLIVAA